MSLSGAQNPALPPSALWRRLPFALLALAIVAIWPTVALVDDVSWLMTVSEKLLDGGQLYRTIIEANPPASVWLYLPAVALARLLHCPPEYVINAQVWAFLALSLGLSRSLLDRAKLLAPYALPALTSLTIAILMLLPNGMFGQREHFLLLALLPILSLLALRLHGGEPGRAQALAAGMLAGLALCIKIYYLAAILAPLALVMQRRRQIFLPLALEFWAMAAIMAAYMAAVVQLTPDFFTRIVPILADVYLPIRRPFEDLVFSRAMAIWTLAVLMLLWLLRQRATPAASYPAASHPAPATPWPAPLAILLAASIGALLPFFIQGKNWPNHAFPMLRLALLALVLLLCQRDGLSLRLRLGLLALVLVLSQPVSNWLKDVTGATHLRAELARIAPHPRMIYIGHILRFAHPLVRQLEGTYLGRVCYQWITIGAEQHKAELAPDATTLAHLTADEALDEQWLIDDLAANPQIVLVQIEGFDWSQRIAQSPRLASLLAPYQDRGTFDGVRILQRPTP